VSTDEEAKAEQPTDHGSHERLDLRPDRRDLVCWTDQQETRRPPDELERSSDMLHTTTDSEKRLKVFIIKQLNIKMTITIIVTSSPCSARDVAYCYR